jgi:hypothetical protein
MSQPRMWPSSSQKFTERRGKKRVEATIYVDVGRLAEVNAGNNR